MPKTPPQDDGPSRSSFEVSLEELQQIVADLEDGTLGLDESMRRFETGITLLRSCYQTLEQAEQKIPVLTGFDAAGSPATAPFDAEATVEQVRVGKRRRGARKKDASPPAAEADSAASEDDDEDGTLF